MSKVFIERPLFSEDNKFGIWIREVQPQYYIIMNETDTYLIESKCTTDIYPQNKTLGYYIGNYYVVVKNIIPEAPKRILNYVYDDPKDFDKEGYRV